MSDTPTPPAPAAEMTPAECALQLKQRFPAPDARTAPLSALLINPLVRHVRARTVVS
jgi:hypothetical protein